MATWIDFIVLGLCAIVVGGGTAELVVMLIDHLIEWWNHDYWK